MIKLQAIGESYIIPNKKEFLLDSAEDVASLPTSTKEGNGVSGIAAPGSFAYTADGAHVYMLGNDDVWHEW